MLSRERKDPQVCGAGGFSWRFDLFGEVKNDGKKQREISNAEINCWKNVKYNLICFYRLRISRGKKSSLDVVIETKENKKVAKKEN